MRKSVLSGLFLGCLKYGAAEVCDAVKELSEVEQVEGLEMLQVRGKMVEGSSQDPKDPPLCFDLFKQEQSKAALLQQEPQPFLPMDSDKKAKEDQFNNIYAKDIWTHGSGPGSTVDATKATRQIISAVLGHIAQQKKQEGKTAINMLDAPCGDMQWMPRTWKESEAARNGVVLNYHGADVSTVVLNKDQEAFDNGTLFVDQVDRSKLNVEFSQIDLSTDRIGAYDLIFMKDVLGHLHMGDIHKVLDNVRASGSKYLLTTTHKNFTNVEISEGMFWYGRKVNVLGDPYNMPGAVCWEPQDSDASQQSAFMVLLDLRQKGAPYKTANSEYCPKGSDITDASACESAAEKLGLRFSETFDGIGQHQFCVYADDGRKKVYFNTAGTDAASKPPNSAFASICKA